MRISLIALVVLLLLGFPAEAKLLAKFDVGTWRGGAYSNDSDGSFSHCSAAGPIRGDVGLAAGVNKSGEWGIGFITFGWPMELGDSVPVRLRFDGGAWIEAEGVLINKQSIEVPMPADSNLLRRFKQGLNLEARIGNKKKTYAFPLTGTLNIMNRLVECVDQRLAAEGKVAPTKTASAPPEPATKVDAEPSPPRFKSVAPVTIGDWEGAAFVDEQTNAFEFCGASVRNNGQGVTLVVLIDRDLIWSLGFISEGWSLKPRTVVPIQLRFGKGPWIDFKGDVFAKDHVGVEMREDPKPLEPFMRSSVMEVRFNKQTYSFPLTGTYRLMQELGICVDERLAMEGQTTSTQPVAAAAKPKEAAPAENTETGPRIFTGTGIIISKSGHIVTNAHVVEGCTDVGVRRVGDIVQDAKVIASDRINDLALLKSPIELKEDELGHLTAGRSAKPGEKIAVYGFPLAGALSSTGNIVEGNITSAAGLADDINHFQISAPVQPGNSGGPLLDFGGGIVGVVNAKMDDLAVANAIGSLPQNVNFAIKKAVLANFLETHDIAYDERPRGSDITLVEIAEKAKKFTVLLVCNADQ